MLAYVALGAPLFMTIIELISKEGFNLTTLPQKVMFFSAGAAAFAFKSMIETLVEMVKNKMKK